MPSMAPPYTNFLGGPVFWGQVNLQAIKFNDEKEYYITITESTIPRIDKNDKTKDFHVRISTFEENLISGRVWLEAGFSTNHGKPLITTRK